MIDLIKMPAANILGLKIEGKINDHDVKILAEAVEAQLHHYKKIDVYVEADHFNGFTLKGLYEHLKAMLPKTTKIGKKAVVTDAKWIHTISSVSHKMSKLVDVQLRTFDKKHKEQALAWLGA